VGYACPVDAEPYEQLSYLDEEVFVEHCGEVYEPAEDTWLLLGEVRRLLGELRPRVCIDVGTGTGVLAAACRGTGLVVATDISPCAASCAVSNLYRLEPAEAVVAQCDLASCLRCPRKGPVLVVFNTPYLVPEEGEEGLLELAWSGGLEPAARLLDGVADCLRSRGGCVVLATLRDWAESLLGRAAERGLEAAAVASARYFFEEIVVVEACSR